MSKNTSAHIVVIGGGVTGVGIARDAALRGFTVTLVEKDQLNSGTSGHFHGLLHSGARYAVEDPEVANECFKENQILRNIAKSAILDTGGFFLSLTQKEEAYSNIFYTACKKAGIPVANVDISYVLKKEPLLTPGIKRAIAVPDAYINSETLVHLNKSAAEHADIPAEFLLKHQVIGFNKKNDNLEAVIVKNNNGEKKVIACDFVINASGIWANQVSMLAGVSINLVADKGSMLVFENQLSSAVLNRCRPAADGDIFVPTGKYSILGTTSVVIDNIDTHTVEQWEIDKLLLEGEAIIPNLSKYKIVKKYAGVRPLASRKENGRKTSRSFQVLDHADSGIKNFISVVGGKVTVYRLMAEKAVDVICKKNGSDIASTTAAIPLEDTYK